LYNKQEWKDEIPDLTRPIMDPSTGKQKTDPQTGRPLFELVQTGTRITSNRLNTMEGGIESAHTLLEKLAKEMGGNFVAVIDGLMGLVCSAEGLKASWTAGVAYVGGRRYEITAGEMALNPTQGQYLYVDIDGVVKKTTSQETAKAGLLLFYVATDTSGVISTSDQRVNLSIQEAYEVALEAKQLGNERKADVVAALIAMGISASTSDTWSQLITKMKGVVRAKGNANPSDVREGKSFSNSERVDIVGTLPERTTGTLTITPGGSTKTHPAGIYGGDIIVPSVVVPADKVLEGTIIAGTEGTIPNRGVGGTVTPNTTNQIKTKGNYETDIVILGDANLKAANIKKGVKVFDITGTLDMGLLAGTQILYEYPGAKSFSSTTPIPTFRIRANYAGTYRVSYSLYNTSAGESIGSTVYAQTYVNGSARGNKYTTSSQYPTYITEDITVNAGDAIELYVYGTNNVYSGLTGYFKIGVSSITTILMN